jgi:hypothetical protein
MDWRPCAAVGIGKGVVKFIKENFLKCSKKEFSKIFQNSDVVAAVEIGSERRVLQ